MSFLLDLVSRMLCVPPAPAAPPGDERSTRVFRAAPQYYAYRLALWGLRQLAFVVAVVLAVRTAPSATAGLGGTLLVAALLPVVLVEVLVSYLAVRLDYEKRWYLVTDRSLRIREGVMRVRETTISFANIQNLSITQGPIQRLLGIADLRVDTAGGGGLGGASLGQHELVLHTASFRGVDNAERIRTLIQAQLGASRDAGLGDPDDAAPGPARSAGPTALTDPAALAALRQIRAACRELRLAASAAGRARAPDA